MCAHTRIYVYRRVHNIMMILKLNSTSVIIQRYVI